MSTIILKQSSVASNVPTAIQLSLGEVAVNTTDGKMHMKLGNDTVIDIVDSAADTAATVSTIAKRDASGDLYANVFQGTAAAAQYADLAEMYMGDTIIEPATVVCFGGINEVTACSTDADTKVAGIVSTNPAYLMNSELDGVAVALTGRVPCKVSGTVQKGDMMVSNGNGGARAEANPAMGSVIGKALQDSEGDAVIEIVVGRM